MMIYHILNRSIFGLSGKKYKKNAMHDFRLLPQSR